MGYSRGDVVNVLVGGVCAQKSFLAVRWIKGGNTRVPRHTLFSAGYFL